MDDVELARCLDGLASSFRIDIELAVRKPLEQRGKALRIERRDHVEIPRETRLAVVHRRVGTGHHVLDSQPLEGLNEISEQLCLRHPEASGRPAV